MTPNQPNPRSRSSASAAPAAPATPSASSHPVPFSPSPSEPNGDSDRKGPVKILRLGRIKAKIWENTSSQKKFYGVSFSRTYVDEAGKFHDSDRFGRDELPLVEKLADRAYTFILEQLTPAKAETAETAAPAQMA